MKAGKSWCLAGLMVAAAFSSASCGKDEGLEGGGGSGSFVGGSGGTAGKGGSGPGRAGNNGVAGFGAGGNDGVSATKLGRACDVDADCADPDAPGLKCVTGSVGEGAPPGGLCTIPCDPAEQGTECEAVGTNALCYPFAQGKGYCIEACSFGAPGVGEVKCHDRVDFACNPALLGDTREDCSDERDCDEGELCIDGTCNVVFAGCLPNCRGDLDCASGTYCDQSFLGGLCVDEKPTGKPLGEPCTVPADDEPSEPDECLGFCQADGPNTSAGHCATNCAFGTPCSWNSDTEKFDGLCANLAALAPDPEIGDYGFCMPACNCTDQCNDPALKCSTELLELPSDFKGPGLCFGADEDVREYNQCTDPGAGGAGNGEGGAGNGGAGSGEGGAGSTPVGGEGGAGGGG